MHFGENQLSPSLISLSPLSTGHPSSFQPTTVRASTRSYPRFTLPMDRSLGFGSSAADSSPYSDSLSLRLPLDGLTLPATANSLAHSSKGTLSHIRRCAPTACKHTVSGSLSLPSRGSFHHSLTVLVRYRSPRSVQPYEVVLADSDGISRAPPYSGTHQGDSSGFTYRAITVFGQAFQPVPLPASLVTPRSIGRSNKMVPQPRSRNACRLDT